LSSLECLVYGLATLGEHLRPDVFPVVTKPWTINFNSVPKMFTEAFPSELLTSALTEIGTSAEMKSLRDAEHPCAPRRARPDLQRGPHDIEQRRLRNGRPTEWLGNVLDQDTTRRPRGWVADALD